MTTMEKLVQRLKVLSIRDPSYPTELLEAQTNLLLALVDEVAKLKARPHHGHTTFGAMTRGD